MPSTPRPMLLSMLSLSPSLALWGMLCETPETDQHLSASSLLSAGLMYKKNKHLRQTSKLNRYKHRHSHDATPQKGAEITTGG